MRYAPPPVQYPVDRPVVGALPAALAGSACAAAWVAWIVQSSAFDARQAVGAAVCIAAIAWAVIDWRAAPRGWLGWNGVCWHWRGRAAAPAGPASVGIGTGSVSSGCDVRITLHLDLQAVILVRVRRVNDGVCPRWLWLERRRSPHAWADVRRAVLHASPDDSTADIADGGLAAGNGAESGKS